MSALEVGTIGLDPPQGFLKIKVQVYETRSPTRSKFDFCIVRFFELWLNSRLAMVSARVRVYMHTFTRFSHTRACVRTGAVEEVGVLEKPKSMMISKPAPPSQYTHEWSRLKRPLTWWR